MKQHLHIHTGCINLIYKGTLSKIKGIVDLVNKSLLKSAGRDQVRPLFSLKGFSIRVTNQKASALKF